MSEFRIPFCPTQASYSVTFGDGISSIQLDGGSARYRAGVQGNAHTVDVNWVLTGQDYALFMGFVRNYQRSGAQAFDIDLSLDSHEMTTYVAHFVPRTLKLVSRRGSVFTVAATLEVLPRQEFEDGSLDYWASLVMLLVIYGSLPAAQEILNLLDKLANEDLPHA